MTNVVKADGSKAAFDMAKVRESISKAARDAGLKDEESSTLVESVSKDVQEAHNGEDTVSSSAIREEVLGMLDRLKPRVSRAWREYDRRYKAANKKQPHM